MMALDLRPTLDNDKLNCKGNSEIGTLEKIDNPLLWPSPWILPIYVISNPQHTEKDAITKMAKCTIDTGNLQGNIVSQDFLVNVLELPPSCFENLTKEEESGGTSITGGLHIPSGAVHLTWYHKNSTRIFRNMRFLISASQDCDIIIGARSIHQDNILNVPCLMANEKFAGISGPKQLPEVNRLSAILSGVNKDLIEVDEGTTLFERLRKEANIIERLIAVYKTAKEERPLGGRQKEAENEKWPDWKGLDIEIAGKGVSEKLMKDLKPTYDEIKAIFGDEPHLLSESSEDAKATGRQL